MPENSTKMVKNKDFYRNEPYIKVEKTCGIRGESAADFILPDYMGDVKRLLKFSACAVPSSKYLSDSEASFLGSVCFRVMYLDSDDKLTEATFSSEYELQRPLPKSYTDAMIETEVQSVAVRLGGPRKMNARASLSHSVYVTRSCEKSYEGLTTDCEMQKCEKMIHGAKYLASDSREVAEELGRLDGVSSDEVEVIKCECTTAVKSTEISEGGVEIKGEACLCAVICVGDEILRLEKKIPFEEMLKCDDSVPMNASACAKLYCVSSSVNVNNENSADGAGCYAAVVMSAILECFAAVDYNLPHSVITDAFLPHAVSECDYEELTFSEIVYRHTESKSFTAQTGKKEWGVDKIRDVIECDAKPTWVKCELSEKEMTIISEIVFNVVARGGDDNGYLSLRCPLEYKRTVNLSSDMSDTTPRVRFSVSDAKLMHDSDKLYFSCEVGEDVMLESERTERVLKSIETCPKNESLQRRITVLFASAEETLFDIAKRYSVRLCDLVKHNFDTIPPAAMEDFARPLGEKKRLIVVNE